jgi:predicted N-formylglutamate amidohydrolase
VPSIPPVEAIEGALASGLLLLCDHAANRLPAEYGSLGLPASEFERHIGYDIGAAGVTRGLAAAFNAPALLTTWSRLLIDPNRGLDDPTLVMRLSDGTVVPGNARIDETEIASRIARFHAPYDAAIQGLIDRFLAARIVPVILSVHSMTPVWKGAMRQWHGAILWDKDTRVALPLIDNLQADRRLDIGDNVPYDGALKNDTLYRHATRRGLPNALIEIRQDLVDTELGIAGWVTRLTEALAPILADPAVHSVEYWGSRTGPVVPWA